MVVPIIPGTTIPGTRPKEVHIMATNAVITKSAEALFATLRKAGWVQNTTMTRHLHGSFRASDMTEVDPFLWTRPGWSLTLTDTAKGAITGATLTETEFDTWYVVNKYNKWDRSRVRKVFLAEVFYGTPLPSTRKLIEAIATDPAAVAWLTTEAYMVHTARERAVADRDTARRKIASRSLAVHGGREGEQAYEAASQQARVALGNRWHLNGGTDLTAQVAALKAAVAEMEALVDADTNATRQAALAALDNA